MSALRRFVASSWAPWVLLAVTLVAHVTVTAIGADPFNMVDLKVYVEGAGHLTDGSLYDFLSGVHDLPFTYPPFSALIFKPFYWLPWTVSRIIWQAASVLALAAIIHLSLRLLGRAGRGATDPLPSARGIVITGTAVAMWMEPVRTTFNYGQINLFLALMILAGSVAAKDWLAGAGVGLAAGIKLIPAITGIYYLLQRRVAVLVWSVVFFAATVVLMLAIIPHETWRYFSKLILDPGRTGPVWSAINQSWRGALSRLAGHDVSTSWQIAVVITLALGLPAAWFAVRAGDRMAALLAVQFTGLLVSPISWSHHWVWVLPLLLWCMFGPRRQDRLVKALGIVWALAVYSYVISYLIVKQGGPEVIATRPGWQSWVGTVYAVLGLATLVVVLVRCRRRRVVPASVPAS